MTSEEDEEIEMIMQQKSRFSRYRSRVREKNNIDINEAMSVDDVSDIEIDDIHISDRRNDSYVEKDPTIHDNQFNTNERQFFIPRINRYTSVDDYLSQIDNNLLDVYDNEDLDKIKSDDFYRSDEDDANSNVFEADVDEFISGENNNKQKTSQFQSNSFNQETMCDSSPNATELSVMLIFLWKRHSLSKAAMDDICRIFNFFNIPNMPKNFRGVVSNVKRHNSTLFHGVSHASGSRVFVLNDSIPVKLRNNELYDKFITMVDDNHDEKDPSKDKARGHRGPCALRELQYFEIGQSFCYDSLHGLYRGVFESNCVSVVHSLAHLAQSVILFGPLYNYSTFNFESATGAIVKSIHGTSLVLTELEIPFRIHRSGTNQVDDSAVIYSDQSNTLHLGIIVGITGVTFTGISTILATRNGGYMTGSIAGAVMQKMVKRYPEALLAVAFFIPSVGQRI
ncbi:unnamed protein product [Rotaria sordida]|uniref:Uncharacterized protein n=2 Tax=Rotaria sordida TaxID=392033 RepID=A0A814KKW4_9BILA|nr:unnamed protein product [Rotaria sordida]CAF3742223.1 unnamed protein product [Rotaria sordida]